jgi:surface protein
MNNMFSNVSSLNGTINFSDTSKVTDMGGMFNGASAFNQPLNFDTSSVTDMGGMFQSATAFNQDLSFNTSNVTNMRAMFYGASSFNGSINFSDTSKVTTMRDLFSNATSFNKPLSFNCSSVYTMDYMFTNSIALNQPLNLDTSSVYNMDSMFSGCYQFNQDISSWNISSLSSAVDMFNNSGLSSDNYNKLLIGWGNQSTIQPNVTLGADSITYTTSFAKNAHDILTNTYNWSITDGGYTAPIVCFKEGSKILTNKGYKCIETLKSGDLVKTLKNGFKPIYKIGKRDIFHPAEKNRIKDQLYKFSKDKHPDVFEDLVLTGCHSVLIDTFKSEEQKQKAIEINSGRLCVTDRKYRLPSCLDERAVVYEKPGTYTIYHIALENDDYIMNYGIYANGLLVETCSKRYLNELSGMILL